MTDSDELTFDLLQEHEIETVYTIESESYPSNEAASLDALRYRQSNAKDLFLGAKLQNGTLVAYICSTLSLDTTLTHASMSTHVPNAPNVCIHSLCVASEYRRKRIASRLLLEYLDRLFKNPVYNQVFLITHANLRGLYERAGFEYVGPSAVVHGAVPWFEMRKFLRTAMPPPSTLSPAVHAQDETEIQIPSGVWEALQRPTRNRPAPTPFDAFSGGIADLTLVDADAGTPTNRYDILCPRPGCGSVILKNRAAQWVQRESLQIDPPGIPANPLLPALPNPPETTHWWLVTPSPMAFENIGFSRAVQGAGSGGKRLKLLACAECDLGPLGWSEEGGSQFWVSCVRVGYRAEI